MAQITGFTENWNEHRYKEVELFIKQHLSKLKDIDDNTTVKHYVDSSIQGVKEDINNIDEKIDKALSWDDE